MWSIDTDLNACRISLKQRLTAATHTHVNMSIKHIKCDTHKSCTFESKNLLCVFVRDCISIQFTCVARRQRRDDDDEAAELWWMCFSSTWLPPYTHIFHARCIIFIANGCFLCSSAVALKHYVVDGLTLLLTNIMFITFSIVPHFTTFSWVDEP